MWRKHTASSSSFFILRSVFILPEPFPWKRWDSCRKAWRTKRIRLKNHMAERLKPVKCSCNHAIGWACTRSWTDLFRGESATRFINVFNLDIWLVIILFFEILSEASVFLSPAVLVINIPAVANGNMSFSNKRKPCPFDYPITFIVNKQDDENVWQTFLLWCSQRNSDIDLEWHVTKYMITRK